MDDSQFTTQGAAKDYGSIIRSMETVYEKAQYCQKIPDNMFNLGVHFDKRFKEDFKTEAWFAWMRGCDYIEREDKIIIGCIAPVRNKYGWLNAVYEKFHRQLERHFEKPIYYGIDGKLYNLAGYEYPKNFDLATQAFGEVKANMRAWAEKNKILTD